MVAEKSKVRRSCRRRVEDFLQLLAKAHVEHLVGLVEHRRPEARTRSSAPRSRWSRSRPGVPTTIWAPPCRARRSFIGSMPPTQVDDPRAGRGVEPLQLLADLDAQARGSARSPEPSGSRVQGARSPSSSWPAMARPKATVLPEPVLRGDDQVAALGLVLDDGRLDGRQRVIAARGQRFRERRGEFRNVAWRQRLLAIGAER